MACGNGRPASNASSALYKECVALSHPERMMSALRTCDVREHAVRLCRHVPLPPVGARGPCQGRCSSHCECGMRMCVCIRAYVDTWRVHTYTWARVIHTTIDSVLVGRVGIMMIGDKLEARGAEASLPADDVTFRRGAHVA